MLYFGNATTADVYFWRRVQGVPDRIALRAARQLDILAVATNLEEVRFAGHGRIAKKRRSKPPRYYIHVLGKWWIGFRWKVRDAWDVKLEER
jgi:plasmid maintenance system killer protein